MHHIIWICSLVTTNAVQISVRTCAGTTSQQFASGKRELTIFETFLGCECVVPVIRGAYTSVNK